MARHIGVSHAALRQRRDEIRDEALRRERGPQVAGLAQFAADQQFGGGLRVRGGGG